MGGCWILDRGSSRGEPLVEVTVEFQAGVDAVDATDRINSECEDFDLYPRPWYDQPQLRVGSATRASLERLFGFRLVRVHLDQFDEATRAWGHWLNAYRWEQVGGPNHEAAQISQTGPETSTCRS